LRIIAGLARGRRLFAPGSRGGVAIRPTADRAREALFNILGWELVEGAQVLDLFAGTGALGLEALSRGAKAACFVDLSPLALELINSNILACGFGEQARVIRHDLLRSPSFWPKGKGPPPAFDLIFLDPPYRQGLCASTLTNLLATGMVGETAQVICEDDSRESLPERFGPLRLYDQRAYGDTGFWFYENGSTSGEGDPLAEAGSPPPPTPRG
jgi:16S rRNA (guanine966-N2)-methyltransferase